MDIKRKKWNVVKFALIMSFALLAVGCGDKQEEPSNGDTQKESLDGDKQEELLDSDEQDDKQEENEADKPAELETFETKRCDSDQFLVYDMRTMYF